MRAICFRMSSGITKITPRCEALNFQDGTPLTFLMEFCSSRARSRRIRASSVGGITLLGVAFIGGFVARNLVSACRCCGDADCQKDSSFWRKSSSTWVAIMVVLGEWVNCKRERKIGVDARCVFQRWFVRSQFM